MGTDQPAALLPDRAAATVPKSLTDAVGYHLRVAQEASSTSFLRGGDAGLKPGRYAVLEVLAHSPGCGPTALSRAVGRDKSTLTATLRDLETHGHVVRQRRPEDGRGVSLSLTQDGRDLLDELRRHAAAHDRRLDEILGEDKDRFVAMLTRITDALGRNDEK